MDGLGGWTDGQMDVWMDIMGLMGLQQCKYPTPLCCRFKIVISQPRFEVKRSPGSYLRRCDCRILLILAIAQAKQKQILLINMITPDGKLIRQAS